MRDYTLHDSGERQQFATGAVRDRQAGKGRFDLLPALAVTRLARHFEKGATKYGDRNWEQGIPLSRFVDSALRHLFAYLAGRDDEDHLVAAAWNLLAALETHSGRTLAGCREHSSTSALGSRMRRRRKHDLPCVSVFAL